LPDGKPRVLSADVLSAGHCELAESPFWDSDQQVLGWVDVLAGQVHAIDPATGARRRFAAGVPVGSAGLTADGRLLLALVDGLAIADADGQRIARLPGLTTNPEHVRFNDGKPDPWGGFWAGTMRWKSGGQPGCLYRLHADGAITELVPDVITSNGLDWTSDKRHFYYIDSGRDGVDLFDTDPDSGDLFHRRRFVDIPAAEGTPDGLTIDAEGGIWVAIWGGGELRRYTPAGALDTVVRLPVRQVTSAAFGGPELRDLFITTARSGLSPVEQREQPLAGDIFCCTPGVAGRPAFRVRAAVLAWAPREGG